MPAENKKKKKFVRARIGEILRSRASPLADVAAQAEDIRLLSKEVREKIADELGEEFCARGLKPDSEPDTYGLELEDLTDALGLARES